MLNFIKFFIKLLLNWINFITFIKSRAYRKEDSTLVEDLVRTSRFQYCLQCLKGWILLGCLIVAKTCKRKPGLFLLNCPQNFLKCKACGTLVHVCSTSYCHTSHWINPYFITGSKSDTPITKRISLMTNTLLLNII